MLKRIGRNKKGATVDNIFWSVTFFGLAIFFITIMIFWNAVNEGMDDVWTGSSVGTGIKNNAQAAVNQFDWILAIVWVGFHLGILVTAYLLRTHPVVYIAAILIIALLTLISAPLSNAYGDLQEDSEMTTAMSSFPMTNFILQHFPKLEVIWGFLTAIIMFAMAKNGGIL